jgi:hypothetical protein
VGIDAEHQEAPCRYKGTERKKGSKDRRVVIVVIRVLDLVPRFCYTFLNRSAGGEA